MIKYILFDAAGTLIHKPTLFPKIKDNLIQYGYTISLEELSLKHKLLSEVIQFPDRTNRDFYSHFNKELLLSLGIIPPKKLLNAIFENCSYLPWMPFEDTRVLKELTMPIGILSNFNNTLKDKLQNFFGNIFTDVLVSEELGVAKPQLAFFEKAIDRIGFNAEDILYVGDSLKLDVVPARQLNMQTLLIDRFNFYPLHTRCIDALFDLNKLQNCSVVNLQGFEM